MDVGDVKNVYSNKHIKLCQVLNMLILAGPDIGFQIKLKIIFCSISLGSCPLPSTCLGTTVFNQADEVNKKDQGKGNLMKNTSEPHNQVKI